MTRLLDFLRGLTVGDVLDALGLVLVFFLLCMVPR